MLKKIMARLLLVGVGLGLALGLVYALLLLFPDLLPSERPANKTIEIRYTETDGDLFYHLAGEVEPPEGEPALISAHTLQTDANGFRLPARPMPHYADYPVVVLGDSFTDAWMVAQPWTDVLAAELDTPVLNLAFRGYGTLEEVEVMRQYGDDAHDWVLLGFFEGNDLQNIGRTAQGLDGSSLLGNLLRDATTPQKFEIVTNPDGNYRYPLALYIGADFYELAFYDFYIWILNGERTTYANSRNVAVFRDALAEIVALSGDACVGVVYMPTKAHIYFQYTEPFGRRWILENGILTGLNAEGWIDGGGEGAVAFEDLLGRMDNQRDVLRDVVTGLGVHFIDLVPTFQAAAAQGQMLYLKYDTHWNQDGQRLAGQTVADYLRGVDC